ncbi:hypothetical protein CGZ93_08080 [Enemella dayhoffiae]|uniref:Uncharacterized protein n=1 Tax=Enemella dayhoffiae TaxID=2016507 RepID=A0A255H2R4_9ACTN|nr:hypothetical protein [Enemella dayhoffiae]OYO21891.1 hypothetical protein CGZ93_08080 [Enemella dayhoffiae]
MNATPPPTARLLWSSVVAALLGSTVMVLVHELVHLVSGVLLGHRSTLYPFGVDHQGDPSRLAETVMLLSAPVFSLLSGLVLMSWLPLRGRAGFWHLAWLWFAFTSTMEGVSYLCLTPFGVGDTGAAASLLGIPVWARIVAGVIGLAGMFWLARRFATHLARHAGPVHRDRMAFSLWPWLIGMLVNMALAFAYLLSTPLEVPGGDQAAILAAGSSTLVFAPMANLFTRAVAEETYQPLELPRIPVAGLGLWALLVAVNLLLLGPGLSVG